jgi:hypothetical protein
MERRLRLQEPGHGPVFGHAGWENLKKIPQEGGSLPEELASVPRVWKSIYGSATGFVALFSAVRATPDAKLANPHAAYFAWPQETAAALAWLGREMGEERELYQCAHLTTRWRRRKEDAVALSSLYVDLDHDQLPTTIPPPSIVVVSSPGKLQAYWRLTAPVRPREGEQLNRRLAMAAGADASGWDLTQLLRVPGSRNHKYREGPIVQLLIARAVAYDPATFADQLPDLSATPPADHRPGPAHGSADRLSNAARQVWDGKTAKRTPDGRIDRSASLVQIARVLFEAGLTRPQIVAALAERDAGLGWEKYTGRRDAEAQYHAIVSVVDRGARTQRRC